MACSELCNFSISPGNVIPSETRDLLKSGSVPAVGDPSLCSDDVFPVYHLARSAPFYLEGEGLGMRVIVLWAVKKLIIEINSIQEL